MRSCRRTVTGPGMAGRGVRDHGRSKMTLGTFSVCLWGSLTLWRGPYMTQMVNIPS